MVGKGFLLGLLIIAWLSAVLDAKPIEMKRVEILLAKGVVNVQTRHLQWSADHTAKLKDLILAKGKLSINNTDKDVVQIALSGRNAQTLYDSLTASIKSKNPADEEQIWQQISREMDPQGLSLSVSSNDKERVIIGESFVLEKGQVLDKIVAIGATGVIKGQVKEIVAIGSDIQLTESAVVSEELVLIGCKYRKHQMASVTGEELIAFPTGALFWKSVWSLFRISQKTWYVNYTWMMLSLFLAWMLGSLYIYLAPRMQNESLKRFQSEKVSGFVLGMMSVILVIPLIVLLAVTIIGIPVIPVFVFAYLAFIFMGYVCAAFFAVSFLPVARHLNVYQNLGLGLLLLNLFTLIPVVGTLVVAIITLVGFGASFKTFLFAVKQRKSSEQRL